MQKDTQIRLMRRVLAHMEARTTDLAPDIHRTPSASYASPEQLTAEQALLFRNYPLFMGMSCQIPNTGDRFTNDLTGIPILVMRGEDGVVRAFVNACSHRGARVADGCGSGRAVVCPYHAWTYNTDGGLRGVPDQRSFPGIDKGKLGLRPLPAVEANGMIWVIPDPELPQSAIDMPASLGELDAELRSYDLGRYHHYETREIRRKMNWKLAIDTFLEPYHLGVLHRDTVGPLFISNLCLFDAFGDHLREVLPRRSMDEQAHLPESEWNFIANNTLVYVLFPNTVFVVQVDHIETWCVFPVPGKVDECVMYLDFFVPNPIDSDSARHHWSRNMDLTIRTVCEEDFPTCEGMQAGFNVGARRELIYGRNEPALAYFQQRIQRSLSRAC